MKIKLLPTLLIVAFVSIGEAKLKIYPFFFVAFILACISCRIHINKKILTPTCAFLALAILFSVYNADKSFDITAFVKLLVNTTFFIFASSYLLNIERSLAISILEKSAKAFLLFSFIQILVIVTIHSLWLLPLELEDSTSSYIIQQSSIIIFGDSNKNIWASKVSIFLIALLSCRYLKGKKILNSSFAIFFGAFNLIYVSSRTAQIAFIAFLAAICIYHYWYIKRRRLALITLALIFSPVLAILLHSILRINYDQLLSFSAGTGGHMGDGLFARFIIWNYIIHSATLPDYIFGNGILSFSYYTKGTFVENNPHNIFLSILLDFGILTFIAYIIFLFVLFKNNTLSRLMLIPFLVFANSQYLGYDADLYVLFISILLISTKHGSSALTKNQRSKSEL